MQPFVHTTMLRGISMNKLSALFSTMLFSIILVACATPATQMGTMEIRSGVIQSIVPAEIQTSHHQGVGAILGALGGAALGSLVGQGTGRDVAMVAGAIGGGYMGNSEQKKYDQPLAGQQIIVRMNNGVLVSVTQVVNPNLMTGMKVYIEGAGTEARVVPQQ
jgi:outer membrane lipoprotein SlyB